MLCLLQFERRSSLCAPDRPTVSWEEYIQAPVGSAACLSRPQISKENVKAFKATIAMVGCVCVIFNMES